MMKVIRQMLHAVVMWRCRNGHHKWIYYQKQTDQFVYFCRECLHCGRDEVQNTSGANSGKWKLSSIPLKQAWEQAEFNRAIRKAI